MLRVYVKPTAIWITPYTRYSIPALEKTLSVYDTIAKHYVSFLYSFEPEEKGSRTGVMKIPKGFGIDIVEDMIKQSGLDYTIIDDDSKYSYPKKINLKLNVPPRNKIQEDSIEFLNKDERQLFLNLDVGTGKTYCSINHICNSGLAAMVISYSLSNQWYEKIFEYTDAVNGKSVVMISSSQYLEDCVKGNIRPNAAIYLVSISTLASYMKQYGNDSIQKISDVLGIGIKIFDEAHVRFLQFNDIDLNMQVSQTIYLSATPGRSNYNENKVFNKIYSHVEMYGSYTSLLNNYYIIRYIVLDSHSTANDRIGMKNMRGFQSMKYVDYLMSKFHDEVFDIIMEYAMPILNEDKKGKILIIIDWLKYIESGKKYLEENYPKYSCGAFCAITKNKDDRQKELDKRIILGTIGSMQNGRDISNLRAVFCLTQYASPIVARQLLGRLRRIPNKDVYYYDISDMSVPDSVSARYRRNNVFSKKSKGEIFIDNLDLVRF